MNEALRTMSLGEILDRTVQVLKGNLPLFVGIAAVPALATFADSLSTGEVDIPGPATKIIAPSGREVPFARKGANLHLLALETGTYRIVGPGGESNIAINPPALPAQRAQFLETDSQRHSAPRTTVDRASAFIPCFTRSLGRILF